MSRDNFGPNVAQVAGAALLISYTITVAVSVAAGADAIISAVPALATGAVPMSVAFVILLAFGNLRGIREAGRVFAIPTYFSIANMAILIVVGLVHAAIGGLGHAPRTHGTLRLGHASGGLILGISAFYLLRAFANGSSAMTGTEAISNGVSIFWDPQARNARTTLHSPRSVVQRFHKIAAAHPTFRACLPLVPKVLGGLVLPVTAKVVVVEVADAADAYSTSSSRPTSRTSSVRSTTRDSSRWSVCGCRTDGP